jgi:hypothetical protein
MHFSPTWEIGNFVSILARSGSIFATDLPRFEPTLMWLWMIVPPATTVTHGEAV